MPDTPSEDPRSDKRKVPRSLFYVAAGLAAAGAVAAAERYMVRRARSGTDGEELERLLKRPEGERRVRSFDGTNLAVAATGPTVSRRKNPATIVFIHGFSLNLVAWHYQWERFSKDYRVVAYDQRGHGRSDDAVGGDYSLEAIGRDLKCVLDEEAPRGPVVLVGHSMGGMAIFSFAEQFPEEFGSRVQAVVLTNTGAADIVKEIAAGLGTRASALAASATRRVMNHAERLGGVRRRAFAGNANLAFLIAKATNFGADAPPEVVDFVVRLAGDTPPEVWSDLLRSIVEMDLSHAIEHIRVPALVLAGDVDRLTPPSAALAVKRKLPQGRMLVFKGAGHCVMLERHEQWNDVVGDFLAEVLPKRTVKAPA